MAAPADYRQPLPAEPFGQAGVMKYAGRLLAWAFMTIALAAGAMSHRSATFFDAAQWLGNGQGLRFLSSNGQFSIVAAPARNGQNHEGWSMSNGYGEHRSINWEPWQTSLGETVGIEATVSPRMRDLEPGQWLRIKWLTIAVLFMVQPVVYVLRRLLARRRAAADAAA